MILSMIQYDLPAYHLQLYPDPENTADTCTHLHALYNVTNLINYCIITH